MGGLESKNEFWGRHIHTVARTNETVTEVTTGETLKEFHISWNEKELAMLKLKDCLPGRNVRDTLSRFHDLMANIPLLEYTR